GRAPRPPAGGDPSRSRRGRIRHAALDVQHHRLLHPRGHERRRHDPGERDGHPAPDADRDAAQRREPESRGFDRLRHLGHVAARHARRTARVRQPVEPPGHPDGLGRRSLLPPMKSLPRTPARSTRSQAGFTLIEIMFAMVVFAIGIMALMLCVPMSSKRIMRSGAQTRASSLASEAAEELLTRPYGNAQLAPGVHNDPANPPDGLYYTRWPVEEHQPMGPCKRITVPVARGAGPGAPEARIVIVTPQSGG